MKRKWDLLGILVILAIGLFLGGCAVTEVIKLLAWARIAFGGL